MTTKKSTPRRAAAQGLTKAPTRKAAAAAPVQAVAPAPLEAEFGEIVGLIQQARQRAYQAVNTELVGLYWRIGATISAKLAAAEWGEGVVESLARHLARVLPGQRGFSVQNLWRMRQFFEAYAGDEKLSSLVRVLPWSHNLAILNQAPSAEARHFYLTMAARERWSVRELERRLRLGAFEQAVLAPAKLSTALREMQGDAAEAVFKDAYAVEFLGLPAGHSEADLHRGLLAQLRRFLVELGRDFCFVGSEFPLQVGGRDFALDLLFFHRGLNCLVAIELKVDRFEPAHLGQLNFYLEALDRQVKKPHENPAIGLLLCASKDDEVVEYTLSRTLSPAAVAQYVTQLPDKRLLAAKLQEFYALSAPEMAVRPARKVAAKKGGGR